MIKKKSFFTKRIISAASALVNVKEVEQTVSGWGWYFFIVPTSIRFKQTQLFETAIETPIISNLNLHNLQVETQIVGWTEEAATSISQDNRSATLENKDNPCSYWSPPGKCPVDLNKVLYNGSYYPHTDSLSLWYRWVSTYVTCILWIFIQN